MQQHGTMQPRRRARRDEILDQTGQEARRTLGITIGEYHTRKPGELGIEGWCAGCVACLDQSARHLFGHQTCRHAGWQVTEASSQHHGPHARLAHHSAIQHRQIGKLAL